MEGLSDQLIEKIARVEKLRNESESKEEVNIARIVQEYMELKVELNMRRRQLKESRDELDSSRLKIQELQYSLDAAKSKAQEYENNIGLAMERNKQWEKNIVETKGIASKALRDLELMKSENKSLKEVITQIESEKYTLQRNYEELQSKSICNDLYRTQIAHQQSKFTTNICEIRKALKKVENQHKELKTQHRDILECKDILLSFNIIKEKMDDIILEKKVLECELIKSKAKLAQLELSLKTDLNLQTKQGYLFFQEWKSCFCKLQEQMKIHDKISSTLMEQLKIEREANTKLIIMLHQTKSEEDSLKVIPVQASEQQIENKENATNIDAAK